MGGQAPTDAEIAATVADDLPVGVWVARAPGGEFVYANKAFGDIMGMGAREDVAVGEYAAPYGIHGRDGSLYPEEKMPFLRALDARATIVVDDIVIHRGDGGRVNIRAQARPMFDEAGEISHVVIAFIDISREIQAEVARAEAEARTLRAERLEAVGQLAGGIAHDFNNLLAAIRLVAGSLRQGEDDPARLEALAQIETASEKGTELTRSLLSFAQRRPQVPVPLSINEVATEVMKLLRLPIDPRLELGADLHASGHILADRSQIDQVLMNLVVNAREAAGSSGVVLVHTRDAVLDDEEAARRGLAAGPYVVIEVRDDGPGIDAAIRDRIFEPYFTTKSYAEHGRGLGLATVFGVVTSHGGVVESASNTPRGTVMRVFLPSVSASAGISQRPAPRGSMTRGRGTVLVVDDEPLVRKATSAALRHLGYDVLGACDGDEGVAMFRENRGAIRLVVLDMVMPRMDGQETLRLLRDIDPAVKVLLTTGNTPEDGELGLGAAGLITKPYGLEELSEAIANAMA